MEIVTLADRPDLESRLWELVSVWPEFMLWDPIADLYYPKAAEIWSEFVLMAVVEGSVAARGFTVPFSTNPELGRSPMPDGGWDLVIRWAHDDRDAGRVTDVIAGLEVAVLPEYRASGVAAEMVAAMKANCERLGYRRLVIPVRPSRKHVEPATPMAEYVARVRDDGLPEDPWLRVHARAGGVLGEVCPTAMTISGTLEQWRSWTGLAFDRSGEVTVDGALVPVHVSVEQDYAVYVEPNVWVDYTW